MQFTYIAVLCILSLTKSIVVILVSLHGTGSHGCGYALQCRVWNNKHNACHCSGKRQTNFLPFISNWFERSKRSAWMKLTLCMNAQGRSFRAAELASDYIWPNDCIEYYQIGKSPLSTVVWGARDKSILNAKGDSAWLVGPEGYHLLQGSQYSMCLYTFSMLTVRCGCCYLSNCWQLSNTMTYSWLFWALPKCKGKKYVSIQNLVLCYCCFRRLKNIESRQMVSVFCFAAAAYRATAWWQCGVWGWCCYPGKKPISRTSIDHLLHVMTFPLSAWPVCWWLRSCFLKRTSFCFVRLSLPSRSQADVQNKMSYVTPWKTTVLDLKWCLCFIGDSYRC